MLTDRSTHFEFGANWRNYATLVDHSRIDRAVDGLKKLFPDSLSGKTFLDLGCGSGVHSVAALCLGASSVTAIDIDENSVDAAQHILTRFAPDKNWKVGIGSVFDVPPELGQFDVVYSWGVLHHTGDMWRAIEMAAQLVRPGGELAIAIYVKTKMDWFWTIEKRIYSRSPRPLQWMIRQAYVTAYCSGKLALFKNPFAALRNYKTRGMDFFHDVHDWLGGYPYEAADASEIRERMTSRGFSEERSFIIERRLGLFGSACSEFVFSKC